MAKKNNTKKTSIVKEAFNTLSNNFIHMPLRGKMRTISFSSSSSNIDKSKIILNLGRTLIKKNMKVVVVDCNFRNSTLKEHAEIDTKKGMTNILVDKTPYENVIIKDQYEKKLDLILCGDYLEQDKIQNLLESNTMRMFLQTIRMSYDFVLIDTPANKLISDANIISSMVDGTILIEKFNYSTKKSIDSSISAIKKVSGDFLGIILSDVHYSSEDIGEF